LAGKIKDLQEELANDPKMDINERKKILQEIGNLKSKGRQLGCRF
jgi:hypothetical protein